MLAIDDRTSSDWAREMRGTASIARAVTPCARSASTLSGLSAGASSEARIAPERSRGTSSSVGALTLATMSLAHTCSALSRLAPAST